jgi:hypothetical protein
MDYSLWWTFLTSNQISSDSFLQDGGIEAELRFQDVWQRLQRKAWSGSSDLCSGISSQSAKMFYYDQVNSSENSLFHPIKFKCDDRSKSKSKKKITRLGDFVIGNWIPARLYLGNNFLGVS